MNEFAKILVAKLMVDSVCWVLVLDIWCEMTHHRIFSMPPWGIILQILIQRHISILRAVVQTHSKHFPRRSVKFCSLLFLFLTWYWNCNQIFIQWSILKMPLCVLFIAKFHAKNWLLFNMAMLWKCNVVQHLRVAVCLKFLLRF